MGTNRALKGLFKIFFVFNCGTSREIAYCGGFILCIRFNILYLILIMKVTYIRALV